MLNDIDKELFPDFCEVASLSSQDHCYLIKKNGSSSLRSQARVRGLQIITNEAIKGLDKITIIIRDPRSRYVSGLHTFAEHLCMENKTLDFASCVWLGDRYRFLNRHYLPQFLWLCNLSRFLDPQCRLIIRGMDHLADLTSYHLNPSPTVNRVDIQPNPDMNLWFFIDQVLVDHVGRDFTWQELLQLYRSHPGNPLRELLLRVGRLSDVLS